MNDEIHDRNMILVTQIGKQTLRVGASKNELCDEGAQSSTVPPVRKR